MGTVVKASQSLQRKLAGTNGEFERELSDIEQALGPMAKGCKDTMLQQLSGISPSLANVRDKDGDDERSRLRTAADGLGESNIRLVHTRCPYVSYVYLIYIYI